jgi:hypothetical protein
MIGVATPTPNPEARVDADMDTLATAVYARTDDVLKASPQLVPWRPEAGIEPQLSDAELVTLAVMQALLGYTSEARWLRHARKHLRDLFPYLPQQPGYNKRLRKTAGTIGVLIGVLARDTSLWTDDPPEGVLVRVMQRILALTAAIWHNDRTGQPVKRSLIAYDH